MDKTMFLLPDDRIWEMQKNKALKNHLQLTWFALMLKIRNTWIYSKLFPS